jgi:hypothetical protein
MKKIALLTLLLAMPLACSKADPGAATGSASGAAKPGDAPKTASAFVQKGIQPGKVVVGYIQDSTDPNQCAAVTDAPAKKDEFVKNADKFAEMVKGKVVPSCPTDSVVGTCNAGFGMLVNYSGPKWTKETAQKDCTSHAHQTWID